LVFGLQVRADYGQKTRLSQSSLSEWADQQDRNAELGGTAEL